MRKTNWQSALHDFIDSRRNEPHQWGKNDCALFVADAVEVITGEDYAASFRGKYKTAVGSLRSLKAQGFESVEGVPESLFKRIRPDSCMKGDVVSITQQGHVSLGICIGHMAVFTGEDGLIFLPMYTVEKAWRVN